MPLKSGYSQKTISDNIKTLYHENPGKAKPRSRKQMIAIAYAVARRAAKKRKKAIAALSA